MSVASLISRLLPFTGRDMVPEDKLSIVEDRMLFGGSIPTAIQVDG